MLSHVSRDFELTRDAQILHWLGPDLHVCNRPPNLLVFPKKRNKLYNAHLRILYNIEMSALPLPFVSQEEVGVQETNNSAQASKLWVVIQFYIP